MENKERVWYQIEGYDGVYVINKDGLVFKTTTKKFMSLAKDRNGYLFYRLTNKFGKRRTELQHRLVAKAFIPNPNGFLEVNHKDENKQNNSIDNLEWCNRLYNMNYGNVTLKTGKKLSKKVYCYFLNGELDKIYASTMSTINDGYEPKHVSECALEKRKTHGKRIWSYYDLNKKEVV